MLSPAYPPDVHQVVSDLIKGIISMATPSPGPGFTSNTSAAPNSTSDGAGAGSGVSSNQFARELTREDSVSKLVAFMLQDFSTTEPEPADENSPSHFESASSSAIHAMGVLTELIRKNNSDYFEPYLFHTLRNRLIQVQQHLDVHTVDGREYLEQAMRDMVDRMGVVNLSSLIDIMCDKLQKFQELLKQPRTLVCFSLRTVLLGIFTYF